jgi:kynureninase
VHERHLGSESIPRLEGWWGNDASNRFKMESNYTSSLTADSWSMSTPPIMLLAAHKAALQVFAAAGFDNLLVKSNALSDYLFLRLIISIIRRKNSGSSHLQKLRKEVPRFRYQYMKTQELFLKR